MADTWTLGTRTFTSRLLVGTGKYPSHAVMAQAHAASGAEMVTVAVRRVNISDRSKESLLDYIDTSRIFLLPNTAACYTAEDAIRTAQLGREAGLSNWVKLEVIGDERTLFPDNEALLEATKVLVKDGFIVTVLKRASSNSPTDYPAGVKVASVNDSFAVEDLVPIFTGQDAVVVTIKGTQVDIQKRLADAAVKAGVTRFIPADFGSCDSSSPHAQDCVPLFANKTELRGYLTSLAEKNKDFTWSSIVCGHFFDWQTAFLHLWPQEKRLDIVKPGDHLKASYSTLGRVGEATSRVLQHPSETANRVLFVQSFCVTQVEISKAFEKASGAKYDVQWFEAEAYEREQKAKRDEGDKDAIENLVWMLGAIEGNWEEREEFAMGVLGLENEDLEEAAKKVVELGV